MTAGEVAVGSAYGATPSHGARRLPGLALGAAASLGAGAVHAAAAGVHAEHPQLARLFVLCAVLQLGAGIVAMVRPGRAIAWGVVGVNAAAVGGWLLTRVSGISWIDGLQTRESPQFADTACALLGAAAFGTALAAALIGWQQMHRSRPTRLAMPGLAAAALAIPAMLLGGTHVHSHSDATAHSHATVAPVAADGVGAVHESQPHQHEAAGAAEPPAVPATPYDPDKPIDLGGVAGVTPQEQAAAENLVAINVVRLPQWSDYRVAEAAGFQSIGDGFTGFEHFINWASINDKVWLDPDHPESLVYVPQPDGSKRLVSAMYMLPDTVKLTDVPDIGGALMQWHIHDNLCFTSDLTTPRLAGVTSGDGTCPKGLVKFRDSPMIHVWITPNACGPFAALEGVGAGQVAPGQTAACDHVHGDGLL